MIDSTEKKSYGVIVFVATWSSLYAINRVYKDHMPFYIKLNKYTD